MAKSVPALVEPSVLRWAGESLGLTTVAAARRLGVPDERLEQWETGQARPTLTQLRLAATVYKRPLGVLFLSRPPTSFDTLRDFRRLPDAAAGNWSPELHGEYRRAHTQRGFALDLAELEDAPLSTTWQLDVGIDEDDHQVALKARLGLLKTSPLPFPRPSSTPHDHLNFWTSAVEEVGVLVLTTERGGVDPKEARAFSLFFNVLPVIVINGSDAPRGRLFSLLHEYAHLLLHTSGLCDVSVAERATTPDRRLEARCNSLAAAMLMPANAVLALPEVQAHQQEAEPWDYASLRAAAAPFGVSAEAFLRRLVTLGQEDLSFYLTRREEFVSAYEQDQASARASGGDWYRNTARDRGKGYVRRVADAYRRRIIDSYTAASYLDVKVSQIDRLAEAAALRPGA